MSNMQGQLNEETVSRYFTLLNYCGKRLTVSKKSPCLDKLVQFLGGAAGTTFFGRNVN